ncbi:MAG: acetylxylan esterase [Lentisphaerae bacterium]|jgi:hypothetical protein|nr:acetylxylan esterase [Lentisphaerota bacterium]
MTKHRNNYILLSAVAASALLVGVTAFSAASSNDPKTFVVRPPSMTKAPNETGFIQLWNVLEPIRSSAGETQNAVQQTVNTEHFEGQFTMVPKDGQQVTAGGSALTWHAVDTEKYNINLHYFANAYGKSPTSALFWAVTVIDCPKEMEGVRLAIGSNSASVWWVNGEEVCGIYGNRQTVVDDGVSKRITLKKGRNVIRGAIINASGAADFCARILDADGKPLKNYTITIE